jgi:hypothetical protein
MISASIRKSPEPGVRFTVLGVDDSQVSIGSFRRYFHEILKEAEIPYTVHLASTFAEGEKFIKEVQLINFAMIDFNLDNGMLGTALCVELLHKNPLARVFLFTAAQPDEVGEVPDGVTVIWEKNNNEVKRALRASIDDFRMETKVRKNSSEGDKG